jgi:hypothetical protein
MVRIVHRLFAIFPFALVCVTVVAIQCANAGSAVAMEIHLGNLATAYGGPVARETQRTLQRARE